MDYEAERYLADGNELWRDALMRFDVTNMGSVLENSISCDDDLYVIQNGIVAKLDRSSFERIHAHYVEHLRAKVRDCMCMYEHNAA